MTTDAASGAPPRKDDGGEGEETHPPEGGNLPAEETFAAPSLRGRHVYLRPVTAKDYPFLQRVEMSTDLLFRWRLRGATPSPEQWVQMVWHQVLAQFMVMSRQRDKPIGLVSIYRPNFQDGYAYLSAARLDPSRSSPLMVLGVSLFAQYVFACWNFRKLYMEVPEFNWPQLASGVGRYFELEGRQRDHFYFDGRYWDQLTLAVYREVMQREGLRLDQGRRSTLG